MYKEVSKTEKNKFLALLGFVFSMIVVMLITNNIIYPINKMFADVINILYFGFGVYFYMRYFMTAFEYKIEDNVFYITRILNKNNPQIVLSVSIEDIKGIEKYSCTKNYEAEKLNFCTQIDKSKRYVFYVVFDSKKYEVLFEPSQKLLELLMRWNFEI